MINDKLKALRLKNNLTLKQLAERTALSPAYLSNVENGRTSPTIDNLDTICKALQYDLANLVSESRDFKPVTKKEDRINIYRSIFTIRNELLTPPGVLMRGTCLTLFPSDNERHFSVGHEHDEYFILTEGKLKVILQDSDEYIMEPGDSIYIRGRIAHSFQRIGEGQAVLYITTAMA